MFQVISIWFCYFETPKQVQELLLDVLGMLLEVPDLIRTGHQGSLGKTGLTSLCDMTVATKEAYRPGRPTKALWRPLLSKKNQLFPIFLIFFQEASLCIVNRSFDTLIYPRRCSTGCKVGRFGRLEVLSCCHGFQIGKQPSRNKGSLAKPGSRALPVASR